MANALVLGMGISALLSASMTVDSPERPESALTREQHLHPQEIQEDVLFLVLGVQNETIGRRLPEDFRKQLARTIIRSAQSNGVDPRLIAAVIVAESGFNPWAVSPVGALGLMQVMPTTGRYWLAREGKRLARDHHLFDPELNIEIGTSYLAAQIRAFGSVEEALVAYNAGPAAARRILRNPDSKMRFIAGYPKKVVTTYQQLRRRSERIVAQNVSIGQDNKT